MSIRAMGLVQERSRAKGSNLHALVIIADYAKDDGKWAWPHPSTIAWKQRLTARAAELILRKLVIDGEVLPEWDPAERRLYLHIRCVCDWDAYRAEGPVPDRDNDREKISRSTSAAFALRLVDLAAANAKFRAANAKSHAEQREILCVQREISCANSAASDSPESTSRSQPYDPSVDPLRTEQGSATPVAKNDDERTPEENLPVITKLAHEVLDLYALTEDVTERDIVDGIELRCCPDAYDIASNRDVVHRAIAVAIYQRRRAGKPAVLKNSSGDSAFRMATVSA